MIKTFRGLLTDGDQNRIRLSTKKGKIGYKIVKFQIMSNLTQSGTATIDHVVKVFKVFQTTVPTTGDTVDLSDGNLLACALLSQGTSYGEFSDKVIFEQEVFNQDIYVTHTDNDGTDSCNYYIELETINMTDNATAVSTLRDIRLNPAPQ